MTVMTTIASPSFTRPKFIILEGCDRTGKSTMQQAINKVTKYKHFVMDRGPIGFKAYCEIFDKEPELFFEYHKMEKQIEESQLEVLVIYLDCSTDVLIQRCIETDHEIIDYDLHKKSYEKYYDRSKLDKVKVDTTFSDVYEIAEQLCREGII